MEVVSKALHSRNAVVRLATTRLLPSVQSSALNCIHACAADMSRLVAHELGQSTVLSEDGAGLRELDLVPIFPQATLVAAIRMSERPTADSLLKLYREYVLRMSKHVLDDSMRVPDVLRSPQATPFLAFIGRFFYALGEDVREVQQLVSRRDALLMYADPSNNGVAIAREMALDLDAALVAHSSQMKHWQASAIASGTVAVQPAFSMCLDHVNGSRKKLRLMAEHREAQEFLQQESVVRAPAGAGAALPRFREEPARWGGGSGGGRQEHPRRAWEAALAANRGQFGTSSNDDCVIDESLGVVAFGQDRFNLAALGRRWRSMEDAPLPPALIPALLTTTPREVVFFQRLPRTVSERDAEKAWHFWGQQMGQEAKTTDFGAPGRM
jgi:hypothetical protein